MSISQWSFLLLATISLAACDQPTPGDISSLSLGHQLYIQHCQSCHGQRGDGDIISPNIQGRTAASINQAISDLPAMQHLQNQLNTVQLKRIAQQLAEFKSDSL